MLVSWEKRAGLHNEGEANEDKDVFQVLLADFWEGLGVMFVRYVDNKDADPQALEGVATLLQVSLFFENSGNSPCWQKGYSKSIWLSQPLVSQKVAKVTK